MGHEDLSVIGVCVVTTPIPEVLTYFPLATPFTTSLGGDRGVCGNHTDTGGPHLFPASHAVHNLAGSYT
ncbi:hypothetical protein MSS4_00423 [Mycobacterium marinum]|nr:hypothetical protein MSS4_00423 [Mycobacterium marinum]